jgi:hypothetical protein
VNESLDIACVFGFVAHLDNPGLPGKTLCAMDEKESVAILS